MDASGDGAGYQFPRLTELIKRARAKPRLKVAVAYPCSSAALGAALQAHEEGLIDVTLVGPSVRITGIARELGKSLKDAVIVDSPDDAGEASRKAVELTTTGKVAALMKGSQHTDELLEAVVTHASHLRTNRRVSHIFWMDVPSYHKPLMLTDAVVNIAPTIQEKADILRNAIEFAQKMGIDIPKVAILSAIEVVHASVQSSVDAAILCKMAERKQLGRAAIVDGPLAVDNAFSASAAAIKGLESTVAGDPDILMVHDLDVGNVLYKSLVYNSGGDCAGLILGAHAPIILTSRADSERARIASCALASLVGSQ